MFFGPKIIVFKCKSLLFCTLCGGDHDFEDPTFTQPQEDAFYEWVETVLGKPYNLSFTKLCRRHSQVREIADDAEKSASPPVSEADFFCSQLALCALKHLGVVKAELVGGKNSIASTSFWPSTFAEGSKKLPKVLAPGYYFTPECLLLLPCFSGTGDEKVRGVEALNEEFQQGV